MVGGGGRRDVLGAPLPQGPLAVLGDGHIEAWHGMKHYYWETWGPPRLSDKLTLSGSGGAIGLDWSDAVVEMLSRLGRLGSLLEHCEAGAGHGEPPDLRSDNTSEGGQL